MTDNYRGLRCNICRKVIGYTTDEPVNVLAETNVLCRDCHERHEAAVGSVGGYPNQEGDGHE